MVEHYREAKESIATSLLEAALLFVLISAASGLGLLLVLASMGGK